MHACILSASKCVNDEIFEEKYHVMWDVNITIYLLIKCKNDRDNNY